MSMYESLLAALVNITHVQAILAVVLGSLLGFIFGIIPGLGALQALALVLPFTFGMNPLVAMLLYAGILGADAFAGAIPAILIRVPGTELNVATIFDGYPMAQRGEAGRAIGLALGSSAWGAFFGLLVCIILLPVVRMIVTAFAAPEFFMLVLFGLAATVVVSRGNVIKGLLAACLGIALSFIGMQQTTGVIRYAFGVTTLWDGIPLIPFFIGSFAVGQSIKLSFEGTMVGSNAASTGGVGEVWKGAKEVLREHKVCFLRSAIIGTVIGIIPGIGGVTACLMSYAVAVQTSAKKALFGKGNPVGVVAPETANNSVTGGALFTTVSFGVPGSVSMAIILGAFILHGLVPGPMLIREHMDVVWSLILGLVISTIFASVVGLLLASRLGMIVRLNVSILIPVVVAVSLLGTYVIRENIFDILLALIFGFFSYGLEKYGYPMVTLCMGFVLGRLVELSFQRSLEMGMGSHAIFFTRPLSVGLFCVVVLTLVLPFLPRIKRK